MEKYINGIDSGLHNDLRNEVIARKIYLSYPTNVFVDNEDIEFEIVNSISNQFKVPIFGIHVVGSAKTGYSYFNNREFVKGESDLDIAIVDSNLFIKYQEIVLRETKGLKDQSAFDNPENFRTYRKYISRGIFRPDLMPSCEAKRKWFSYFNKLSEPYFEMFENINGGIYLSQYCFELKQSDNIDFYKKII